MISFQSLIKTATTMSTLFMMAVVFRRSVPTTTAFSRRATTLKNHHHYAPNGAARSTTTTTSSSSSNLKRRYPTTTTTNSVFSASTDRYQMMMSSTKLHYSTSSSSSSSSTTKAAKVGNQLDVITQEEEESEDTSTAKTKIITISSMSEEDKKMIENWRDDPRINPTLTFPTLLVPAKDMHRWIQDERLQPFLSKPSSSSSSSSSSTSNNNDNNNNNNENKDHTQNLLQHIHPRVKMVQDYTENDTHKLVLLHVGTTQDDLKAILSNDDDDNDTSEIQWGPLHTIDISHRRLSFSYILSQLLPTKSSRKQHQQQQNQNHPSAYEQIGHVAHFNLKPYHLPYGNLIGQVLMDTNPTIETVVNKVGQVKGKYRTYDLQILASSSRNSNKKKEEEESDNDVAMSKKKKKEEESDNDETNDSSKLLETTVVEHGVSIKLNVAECYWCTRLSGERQELLGDILKGNKKQDHPLVVADIFCGVGAVCLLLAKALPEPNCKILANDWNPKAIEYMSSSITKNHLNATQFELTCGDAYDFLMDLGSRGSSSSSTDGDDDGRDGGDDNADNHMPDHVLMNYPLEAPTFLGALRWWPSKRVAEQYKVTGRYPRFHVYTFAKPSAKGRGDEEEVAVDIIANELLPVPVSTMRSDGDQEEGGEEESHNHHHSRDELNREFDADVQTRLVRDVAPGKVVVCVGFSLTPKLVRYMQGDF